MLAPLAGYLFATQDDSRRFCLILGAWTGMFSILLIFASLQLIEPSVVNAYLFHREGFVTRLYTPMADLVLVTFMLSLAYALLETGPGRRWAVLLAVLTGLGCALSLTRALYIGILVGVAAAVCVWVLRGGVLGQRVRRRLALTAACLGITATLALMLFPQVGESGPVSTIGGRVESGVSALAQSGSTTTGNNTFIYRGQLSNRMLAYLGDQWPLGLGFVPPSTHYVVGLPGGTIRNPDVGILNGVMTMGVLGTILLYVPLLMMLLMLLKRSDERQASLNFVWFGLVAWSVCVMVSSATLITLYSTTGLTITGLVLGYAGRAMLSRTAVE
jgi:hypothetical protein